MERSENSREQFLFSAFRDILDMSFFLSMDAQIHEILKQSGNAKGITLEESLSLLVLKNPTFLQNFESRLRQEVEKGTLPVEEVDTAMNILEDAATAHKNNENAYISAVSDAFDTSFLEVLEDELDTQKKQVLELETQAATLLS